MVPDWRMKPAIELGCRTGLPAYVVWRAGTAPVIRIRLQSSTKYVLAWNQARPSTVAMWEASTLAKSYSEHLHISPQHGYPSACGYMNTYSLSSKAEHVGVTTMEWLDQGHHILN